MRAGDFWFFSLGVNGLDKPGSDRLVNVKIISLPGGTGSESSGIVSSGCHHFYGVGACIRECMGSMNNRMTYLTSFPLCLF